MSETWGCAPHQEFPIASPVPKGESKHIPDAHNDSKVEVGEQSDKVSCFIDTECFYITYRRFISDLIILLKYKIIAFQIITPNSYKMLFHHCIDEVLPIALQCIQNYYLRYFLHLRSFEC